MYNETTEMNIEGQEFLKITKEKNKLYLMCNDQKI